MTYNDSKPMRAHKQFSDEIRDIARQRLITGKDNYPQRDPRLTVAITRHPLWPNIKKDIVSADLKERYRE